MRMNLYKLYFVSHFQSGEIKILQKNSIIWVKNKIIKKLKKNKKIKKIKKFF